ncbi:MAG: signal recognition particle protein, partial [Proteobacteria bacterium]|nr:signal recognition particle protein [Pseudomonadota bacterium]
PGINKFQDKITQAGVNDSFIQRQIAIIRSMTKKERKDARLINGSRKRRIAMGSGTSVQDVNKLLKQYRDMSDMMKRMQKLGKKGFLRQGLQGLMPHR